MIRLGHIRTRLAVRYTLLLGGILLVCAAGVALFFLGSLREEFDRNLVEHYERAARHLEVGSDGGLRLRKPESIAQNPNRDFAREMLVEAWSSDGRLLYRSVALGGDAMDEAPRATGPGSEKAIRSVRTASAKTLRLMTGTTKVGDGDVVLRVALDEGRIWYEIGELLRIFLFVFPVALLLSGASGYWMAKHALDPVDKMSQRAEAISAENLGERLPVNNPDDELGSLAKVIIEFCISNGNA